MNEIEIARKALESLCEAAVRLASVTVSETTRMCADRAANEEFTRLTAAAETAILAAGETRFHNALDKVRRARQAFFVPQNTNRENARHYAALAQLLFNAAAC